MAKVTLVHVTKTTKHFKNGVEFTPSAEETVMFNFFGGIRAKQNITSKSVEVRTDLFSVTSKKGEKIEDNFMKALVENKISKFKLNELEIVRG